MKKIILILAGIAFVLASFPVSAAPGLTNRAIWSWDDLNGNSFTNNTKVGTNYFKFVIFQGSAVNPIPRAGETIMIPFTVQNVGNLPMTAPLLLNGFFPTNLGTLTITTDAPTAKVVDGSDATNVISQACALPSGGYAYYWVNILLKTNLAEGVYGYILSNSCAAPFPLSVRYSNVFSSYLQTVTVMSASDGAHTITNFDGSGLLGDLDATITIRFLVSPGTAWLYYDIGADPDGSLPDGTTGKNRRAAIVKKGKVWVAKIPVSDPEIKDGKEVRFIVVADGRIYYYSPTGSIPFSYSINQYASQPLETDKPATIANNVGDFSKTPARLIYTVTKAGFVNITVYDIRGAVIRIVKNESVDQGRYADQWDAMNDAGNEVAAGLYFIHIETPEFGATFKLLLVKR